MSKSTLLSIKEIANQLGRSESYVFAMKRKGFRMTGNRATLGEARIFLQNCPQPLSGVFQGHQVKK